MKVTIQCADFAKMVGKIQSVVPTKPSSPILANVLIEAKDDELVISATDSTVSMRIQTKAQVELSGAITLPSRRLFQLARELTTPELQIETPSPEMAIVRAGSSNFKIQGMHKSEFPVLPDLSEGITLHIKAETLREMFNRTSFAAAREDSRQVLNGVLMQRVNDLATFIGTDGKKLARNRVSLGEEVVGSGSYVFPLKSVDEIVKMLDDKEERVKVTVMAEKLAVEAGSAILITKLLAGQYPDVSRVIPKKSDSSMTLHRDELITLLRQVALFTSEGSNSVRFTFEAGALQLSAASGEIGEGKVSMPVNYTGPKIEIAFNPHYFLDILRHSKDETVQLDVSDSYTPGLITDSSEAEFIIMPMRLEG